MLRRICCLLVLLPLVAACGTKEDADVIRELIRKSAELAEAKKVGDLLQQTADGFVAMPGRHGVSDTRSILAAAFMHYGRFKIHYPRPIVKVEPDGNQASATIYFVIVRQNQRLPDLKDLYENPQQWLEAVGEKADLYQMKIRLLKKNSEWKVVRAQLDRFQGISL